MAKPLQPLPADLGKVYLIPVPLAPDTTAYLPQIVIETAPLLKHYFVEKIRTARRFLKAMNAAIDIGSIEFVEMNRYHAPDTALLHQWLTDGYDVGVMSEAGCPGVADPGAEVIAAAHRYGAKVIPLPGPNSMLMALMASGFNGQSYRFLGYLPIEKSLRKKAILDMEKLSQKHGESQIFMETPYRNDQLFQELLSSCHPETQLCVATDLTASTESVKSLTVAEWKQQVPDLHKHPTVFILLVKTPSKRLG